MKIITWNCNMAFRNKYESIISEKPDILIIPECESLEKLKIQSDKIFYNDFYWYGLNVNKGLGIFTFGNLKIKLIESFNPNFKFIIALSIYNKDEEFTVLAVWTQKPSNHDCYTEQIWNAVNYYEDLLNKEKLIIVGDFNSNTIWDKPKRVYNHSNLVKLLEEKNILSSYHIYHKEKQGEESNPTLFLHRKFEKPYHIDYCFTSKYFIERLYKVEVGNYENWTKLSDHKPLIITFN